MRHCTLFRLVIRIPRINVQTVLTLLGQLDLHRQLVLIVYFVFHQFVQFALYVIMKFAMYFQQLGQLESQLERGLMRFDNGVLVRDGHNIEMTLGFHGTPFARCARWQRMHALTELFANNLVFAHTLQLETLTERIRFGLDQAGKYFNKVLANLWHMNIERNQVVLDCVQHVAFQFDSVHFVLLFVGQAQVKMKCQSCLEIIGHAQLDIASTARIGQNHCLTLIQKVQMVMEKQRAHKRQRLELFQCDRLLKQLPFGVVWEKLEYELFGIGQKVMLVILVFDLVS